MYSPDHSSKRQYHLETRNGRSSDDSFMSTEVDAMHDGATKDMEKNGSDDGVDDFSGSSQVSTQRPQAEKSDEERDQGQEIP